MYLADKYSYDLINVSKNNKIYSWGIFSWLQFNTIWGTDGENILIENKFWLKINMQTGQIISSKKAEKLPEKSSVSPNGKWIASIEEGQLELKTSEQLSNV